jgi:putative addiction module component (TIGR02574 family)
MMRTLPQAQLQEILALPVSERLRLAEALWQSLEGEPEVFHLTDGQRQLLDRRLDAFLANPDDVLSWDEVKASLRHRQT